MRKLRKSGTDKMLFGVCGGLGEYFDLDPVLVRVAFVALCFVGGTGFLLYIILAIVMPSAETAAESPGEAIRQNVEHMAADAAEAGQRVGQAIGSVDARKRRNTAGFILIAIGAVILLGNFGAFS